MADFLTAYNTSIPQNEGGFNKNLGDGEGMDYRGLTEKSDPNWSGWAYIKNYIAQNGYPPENHVFPDLESSVQDFYQNGDGVTPSYWQMAQGDNLISQDMANFIFYFYVSSGRAGKEITAAINKGEGSNVIPIVNGALSNDAVSYLNNDTNTLYPVIYQAKQDYLQSLATWGKYGKSWERGMAAFPSSINFIPVERAVSTKTGYYSVLGGAGCILIGVGLLIYFKMKKK